MIEITPLTVPARTERHPEDPRPRCESFLKKGPRCSKSATYRVKESTDRLESPRLLCGLHTSLLQARHQRLGDLPAVGK